MDVAGTRSLRDLLVERAVLAPDALFLVHEGPQGTVQRCTYGELLERVHRTATSLAAIGIGPGDAVVLLLPNRPEFLYTWFGLAWLGAVSVPVHVGTTARELAHVVSHAEAVGVVTTRELAPMVVPVAGPAVGTDRIVVVDAGPGDAHRAFGDLLATSDAPPSTDVSSDDVVQMLFTSGTTALPKAVLLTHANSLTAGARVARTLGLTPDDRLLTAMPLHHVNAQETTLLAALDVGATCILLERYSASRFWEQVRGHGATVVSLVAMHVRTLLSQPVGADDREHNVRRNIYAINVTDEEKQAFEERFGLELLNGYGLTEAGTLVTIAPVFGARRWPSVGPPALDRQVRVVDEDGQDVEPGRDGEILVGGIPGRTLMKGYHRDPEATRRALRGGWLHTGDHGHFDEKGYLHFVDRKKDLIKVAGENVSATEVEAVLLSHPDIAEAAVIGVPDPVRDEAVKAIVVIEAARGLSEDAVVAHCRGRLSSFKLPSIVEFRESLPRTSIGKVAKKQLRWDVEATPRGDAGSVM